MTATDAELTAIVLATRDADAFGELVRRHQALVRNMLVRMAGDRAAADDLAQETFVHAFERLDQFTGRGAFKGWLCRIAYTKCVDAARKRDADRRLLAAIEHEPDRATPAPAADAGDALDLERALARLKDVERASVVLCYACGMSHAEAAEVMALPVGTVKSHVLRGRKKLEELLRIEGRVVDD